MGFRVEALRASRVLGLSIGLERSKFRDYIGFRALGMHDTRGVPAKLCASHPGVGGGGCAGPHILLLLSLLLLRPQPGPGDVGAPATATLVSKLMSRPWARLCPGLPGCWFCVWCLFCLYIS